MPLPNLADLESSTFLRRILEVEGTKSSPNPEASAILVRIATVSQSLGKGEPKARESLIKLSQALIAALELPSEAIQRMGWDEVSCY